MKNNESIRIAVAEFGDHTQWSDTGPETFTQFKDSTGGVVVGRGA